MVASAMHEMDEVGLRAVIVDCVEALDEGAEAGESFRGEADLLERRLWGEPVESSGRKSSSEGSDPGPAAAPKAA